MSTNPKKKTASRKKKEPKGKEAVGQPVVVDVPEPASAPEPVETPRGPRSVPEIEPVDVGVPETVSAPVCIENSASLSEIIGPSRPACDKDPFKEQTEDYSKPKLFVASPCYCGQVHVKYMESMMGLAQILARVGIGLEFFTIPFDSLIPRARNASVTRFMQSKDATHLLFIDADIQFQPAAVVKMLREDKDVIAGCYPKKALDFEAIKENYSKTESHLELIQSSVKYAFNFKPQKQHRLERGVVEVLDAPTGFMMVNKNVFRRMIRRYPETEYKNDVQAYQVTPEDRFFDLFQSQVFEGRYLSEDYGFCRLWQNMGGSIHADLTVKLNHIGQFCYFGDPIAFMKHSKNIELTPNNVGA